MRVKTREMVLWGRGEADCYVYVCTYRLIGMS